MLTQRFRMCLALVCCFLLLPQSVWPAEPVTENSIIAEKPVDEAQVIPSRIAKRDVEPVYRGASVDTLATIIKRGTLKVGVAISEPMVMHNAEGELIGFSIDLAKKLAEDMGVELEFVPTSWSLIIEDLIEDHFDMIISGFWVTPTRALVVNYSNPTATEGVYLVANKANSQDLHTVEDFNRQNVKIAVFASSLQEKLALHHFPNAEIVPLENDANLFSPLLEGTANAVLAPTFAPHTMIKLAEDTLRLVSAEPVASTFSAIGVRKGDADILNYLNTWLAYQRDGGWLQERASYWQTSTEWME